ncbi:hypothetical protein IZY60_13625 [Lutibacter sp. B2]|nr:hypothetical protein [Lutibacter sp. B2]
MKKKILIIIIIAVLAYGVHWLFSVFDTSIDSLPKGDLISEVQSPNATYTIKAYISSGGSTTANAIRGELNFNNTRNKPKNIYWNYREDKAVIKWVDNDTVIINGHELDVLDERFDFRKNN